MNHENAEWCIFPGVLRIIPRLNHHVASDGRTAEQWVGNECKIVQILLFKSESVVSHSMEKQCRASLGKSVSLMNTLLPLLVTASLPVLFCCTCKLREAVLSIMGEDQ